ncbi:MAG: TolC family protein [Flavipsychrobacter sp.]|nr:TolC family protein [Flavipsychrobacter sp.]
MKRIYFTMIGITLAASAARAQTATPLSLQQCMDYAMKHNYTIKNAALDVLIQQAQNDQTVSASLPHINGKADFSYFNIPQRSFIDASTFATPGGPSAPPGTIIPISFTIPYTASVGLTTSQLLFDGSVFVALQARKTVMEFAKQNGKVTEETIRYNVYKAYNSLVIAYRQYDIIKSSLAFARSLEHDITVTQQTGFAERIDVERTSVQVNNLATDSMRIGNLLNVSEQMLKFQIGMDINTPIVLTDTSLEQRRQEALSLVATDKNYERVPEYNLMTTALRLNEFNLRRYKLAALPSLSGFWAYGANYGSNKFKDVLVFDKYWSSSTLGLSLNVPIFNGFMRKNQVTEAKLNVEKAQNNIENIKQTIDFQASVSRTTLKNAMLQAQSQKRNLDVSNDVLDLARKKYKAGVGSNLEVTQAQTDLLQSQNNYFSALLEITNAEADLKKALGLLK